MLMVLKEDWPENKDITGEQIKLEELTFELEL